MPFQYLDINNYEARDGELFIFDANVWLFWLSPPNAPGRQRRLPYLKFLNYLQGLPNDPIVLLPACILSEVMNKLFHRNGDYFKRFLASPDGKAAIAPCGPADDNILLKKAYRPHLRFYRERNAVYESIFSFSPLLEFLGDTFNYYKFDDLKFAVTELDFTDWQIWEMARDNKATIVTDDGDFVLENFPIVTNNSDLLARNPPPPSITTTPK